MKKLTFLFFALICSTMLMAQTNETKTKSKVTVKDGKDVTVTGCVEQSPVVATDYMLTHVADKKGALDEYLLVGSDGDLGKHLGHRVEINGKATDRGKGKVTVETESKSKVENGQDTVLRSKTDTEGDLSGMPVLGIRSLKMIAAVCR